MSNEKIKIILKIVGAIVAIVVAIKLLLPDVSSPEFKAFVESQGILGPLAIIGYTIVSHVVAPLVGSPVVFLSIAVFGAAKSMLFLYIACMISSVINFYISRKLGRKWVIKLAGQSTMDDIDKFLGVSGKGVLAISRIFGFALFDVISYAAGFTKIKFRKYFLITAICAIIPTVGLGLISKNIDFTSKLTFIVWSSSLIFAGFIFAYIIKKRLSKRLANLKNG